MSKIAFSSDPQGSGTLTIASPATNTNRTLTLPDNTGTILTSASALATSNLTGRVAVANAPSGSVIQVINRRLNGTTQNIPSTNNVEVQLTGWSQTITKLVSTSKIVGIVHYYNYSDVNPSGWWYLDCKVGGVQVTSAVDTSYGISSHNPTQWTYRQSAHQQWSAQFWDIRTANSVTYDFFHRSVGATQMVWWNNPVLWTFYEVIE
jgi:hypothetical protein